VAQQLRVPPKDFSGDQPVQYWSPPGAAADAECPFVGANPRVIFVISVEKVPAGGQPPGVVSLGRKQRRVHQSIADLESAGAYSLDHSG
jgi:hypothetical protein